jgi:hypothetical protein
MTIVKTLLIICWIRDEGLINFIHLEGNLKYKIKVSQYLKLSAQVIIPEQLEKFESYRRSSRIMLIDGIDMPQ